MNKFNLKFGAPIQAHDKKVGDLQYVVVNEKTTHVTHLIVTKGTVLKKAYVLSISLVEATDAEGIHLVLYSDELENYPQFEEKRLEAGVPQPEVESKRKGAAEARLQPVDHQPHADGTLYVEEQIVRQGVEPEDVLWSAKTAVHSQQNQAGHLSGAIVHREDGRIHELVMRQGNRYEKFLVIPRELLERATDSALYLQLNDDEITELIEFFEYNPEPLAVNGKTAEEVMGVEKPLIDNLEKELTAALVESGLMDTAVVELICDRQVVTLTGTVPDQKTKEAIASLVADHPHALSVNNELQVSSSG